MVGMLLPRADGKPEGRKSAWPFAVTLDVVLATAKENLLAGAGGD
jgi:hypothetical protein